MLQRVRIRGFKTIVDVTLELGQLNVFTGPNGAGKTNLLEGVALLGCAAAGEIDAYWMRTRGIRTGMSDLYASALTTANRQDQISLEGASEHALYSVNLVKQRRNLWEFADEAMIERDHFIARRKGTTGYIIFDRKRRYEAPIWPSLDRGIGRAVLGARGRGAAARLLRRLESFTIYVPCTPMLRDAGMDLSSRSPMGIHGGDLDKCASGLMQSTELWRQVHQEISSMVPWLGEAWQFIPEANRLLLEDLYLRPDIRWISTREADRGMLHLLFAFMLLLHPWTPPLLGIENVDHVLDAPLVRRMTERVQHIVLDSPRRRQVLWATQRTEVLDVLDFEDDRVRVFKVYRDIGGETIVESIRHTEAL
ncbi:AAA family ATPase [Sorangium sp. So ce260]|uniref:AAA family ATPase n=1 Tax=Sorangium sp. So ce260 TaxID=3133291 RepID=UPI003F6002A5